MNLKLKMSKLSMPLALQVTLLAMTLSTSTITYATHSWGPYHWARTTPQFTLKLGNNLTNGWENVLLQTSIGWNSPSLVGVAFTPVLTAVVSGASNKRCSMVLGTTQVCNGAYGKNGWLGLATIKITTGNHISQGTAKLNDTYFNTITYNNPNEKLHVMCQEVAHTFGLNHQSEDGSSQNSCMDYFSNTGPNATSTLSTKPNAHDFEQLNIIYAHLDNTSTVASLNTSAPNSSESSDDPKSWGKLVEQSSNGRSSTYQKFNADGSMMLTHVYWTLESAEDCNSCDHRTE